MSAPASFWRTFAAPVGLAFLGCVAVVLLTRGHDDPLDNPAYDSIVRAHTRKMAADSVAYAAAKVAILHDTVRVSRAITSYETIRDSVFVPVTHAETVAVLDRLPRFLVKTDSLKASCSELKRDTAPLLTTCEEKQASLAVDRDFWKDRFTQGQPSRWDAVKEWGIRAGLFYLGVKAAQAAR